MKGPTMELTMTDKPRPSRRRHALAWAAIVLAGLVGAKYGYDFGVILGGPLLGVLLALNLGVFASFVVDGLIERLAQLRSAGRQRA